MAPPKFASQVALKEEIVSLEAEVDRVVALSITSDISRADLVGRLLRLKRMAGM